MENDNNFSFDENYLYPKSIISESPEFTTIIDYDDPLLKPMEMFKKKISRGSLFNALITLIAFSPSTICFFINFTIKEIGILPSLVILLLEALFSYYSMTILLEVITEKREKTYYKLLSIIFSKKMLILYEICLFLYYINLAIIYSFSIKPMVRDFANIFNPYATIDEAFKSILIFGGLEFAIQIPTIFFFKFSLVQMEMILLIIFIIASIPVIIGQIIFSNMWNFNNIFLAKNLGLNYLIPFTIYSILFANQTPLHREVYDMNLYTLKRGNSLINRTSVIELIVYIIFGFFEFIVWDIHSEYPFFFFNINNNTQSNSVDGVNTDIPLAIIELMILGLLNCKIISVLFDLVNNGIQFFREGNNYENENTKDIWIKKIAVFILAIFTNGIGFYLEYLTKMKNDKRIILIPFILGGGVSTFFLFYYIPIKAYGKVFKMNEEKFSKRKINTLFFIFMEMLHISTIIGSILYLYKDK